MGGGLWGLGCRGLGSEGDLELFSPQQNLPVMLMLSSSSKLARHPRRQLLRKPAWSSAAK